METLGQDSIERARDFVTGNCDAVYRARFEHAFFGGDVPDVVAALLGYRNDDGGFGHGLEADFLTPRSSAIATTVACQVLSELTEPQPDLVAGIVGYFERTYDAAREGWWTVPAEVNGYPHAPWWTHRGPGLGTVLDEHWGNPSAEILGYLWKWQEQVEGLDLPRAVEHALRHLRERTAYTSEHEIYCYIRMYDHLPAAYRQRLEPRLGTAITQLVVRDESKWATYVPKPLDFVTSPTHDLFRYVEDSAGKHCDFLVRTVDNGVWYPTWTWGAHPEAWERSRKNWTAELTIRNYKILRTFGRIQSGC